MPTADLAFALLVLLLTPGPTNTLILLSGAERGFRKTLRLIPFELAAYLATVVPLTLLAQSAGQGLAVLRPAIAMVACVWVFSLAWQLWRSPVGLKMPPTVTPQKVFLTTLLNPKALVIGLVLLADGPLIAGLALFSVLVVLAAMCWAALGSRKALRKSDNHVLVLRRVSACWLALLSLGILANGFST